MSHSLQKVNIGNNALIICKIIDYVQGGESFTLGELGLTGSLTTVIFLTDQNVAIRPKLVGAKVQLFAGGDLLGDMPNTSGLNFVFCAVAQGTN